MKFSTEDFVSAIQSLIEMSEEAGDIDIMVDAINEDDNTVMVDMLTLGNFVSQFSTMEKIEAEEVVKCFVTLTTNEQDGILEAAKNGLGSEKPVSIGM